MYNALWDVCLYYLSFMERKRSDTPEEDSWEGQSWSFPHRHALRLLTSAQGPPGVGMEPYTCGLLQNRQLLMSSFMMLLYKASRVCSWEMIQLKFLSSTPIPGWFSTKYPAAFGSGKIKTAGGSAPLCIILPAAVWRRRDSAYFLGGTSGTFYRAEETLQNVSQGMGLGNPYLVSNLLGMCSVKHTGHYHNPKLFSRISCEN